MLDKELDNDEHHPHGEIAESIHLAQQHQIARYNARQNKLGSFCVQEGPQTGRITEIREFIGVQTTVIRRLIRTLTSRRPRATSSRLTRSSRSTPTSPPKNNRPSTTTGHETRDLTPSHDQQTRRNRDSLEIYRGNTLNVLPLIPPTSPLTNLLLTPRSQISNRRLEQGLIFNPYLYPEPHLHPNNPTPLLLCRL